MLDAVFAGAEGVTLGFVESDLSAGADAVVSAFVSLLSADFSVALSPEDSPAAVFGFEADFAQVRQHPALPERLELEAIKLGVYFA